MRFITALLLFASLTASAADRKPNIVFILADDLGYGDLGCYGQTMIATPMIDRLASQGMRFTQAYAGATVCAPSRCSLMTGLHGGHARIRGNKDVPLRPEDVTVAKILKDAGYATALIGKWGLGDPGSTGIPTRQGFDYFFGYTNQTHAHNSWPEYLWRNEEKVVLQNKLPEGAKTRHGEGVSEKKVEFSNELFIREAGQYIQSNKAKPFFLYLALTAPHANNEGKQNGIEVISDAPYTDKPWPQNEKNKAALVAWLDGAVGRVMESLKEAGIDQDTLVLFTSDNGPHKEGGSDPAFFKASGPLRGIKRDLYEGGIRVPFIARWPGKIAAGVTSDAQFAFWDFLPTAAELAGASDKVPPKLDGISFVPTLLGKPQTPHEYLYWEFHERGFTQAIRAGNWKAVRHGTTAPIELYDLSKDLGEASNVTGEHPQVVARMQTLFSQARVDSPEFPITDRPRKPAKPVAKPKKSPSECAIGAKRAKFTIARTPPSLYRLAIRGVPTSSAVSANR